MNRTIEGARSKGYRNFGRVTAYREGYCIETVMPNGSFRSHQCSRKIWKDGYCKQHHPDTIKENAEKRQAKWEAERERRNVHHGKIKEQQEQIDELTKFVKEFNKYLSFNDKTHICSGSILHKKGLELEDKFNNRHNQCQGG